jgi:hypothetical protein
MRGVRVSYHPYVVKQACLMCACCQIGMICCRRPKIKRLYVKTTEAVHLSEVEVKETPVVPHVEVEVEELHIRPNQRRKK